MIDLILSALALVSVDCRPIEHPALTHEYKWGFSVPIAQCVSLERETVGEFLTMLEDKSFPFED